MIYSEVFCIYYQYHKSIMLSHFQVHILALFKMKHTMKAYLVEIIIYLGGNKHDRLFKETIESFRQNF